MKDNPKISQGRFNELGKELNYLESVERKKISQEVVQARAQGDLSENSEYHAARNALGECDGKIEELKKVLSKAEIINEEEIKTKVCVGCTVIIKDNYGKELKYIVVDPVEANILDGKISKTSPVGSALFNKKINDEVTVVLPNESVKYTIIKIY